MEFTFIKRKYNENKYGICYTTTQINKLVAFLKGKGFKRNIELSNKKAVVVEKDNSSIELRKNSNYWLVVAFSSDEKKIDNQIILAERLGLLDVENDPKIMLEEKGNWVHSDLFGNSIKDISEAIIEYLVQSVERKIRNYFYLRNKDSYDVAMDILINKWYKNENYFYGNKSMLIALIDRTVENYLNTLHTTYKRKSNIQGAVSFDDTVGEDETVLDKIANPNNETETDMIRNMMLSELKGIEKEVVSLLIEGYKIPEIGEKLNCNDFKVMEIANNIRIN